MRPEETIKQKIRAQLERLGSELKGYRVFLFGSRVAGRAHERSDFDVGIFGDSPIPLATFYRIEDLLEAIDTLYIIDWVDLNRADPAFRREVLENAEVLYEG